MKGKRKALSSLKKLTVEMIVAAIGDASITVAPNSIIRAEKIWIGVAETLRSEKGAEKSGMEFIGGFRAGVQSRARTELSEEEHRGFVVKDEADPLEPRVQIVDLYAYPQLEVVSIVAESHLDSAIVEYRRLLQHEAELDTEIAKREWFLSWEGVDYTRGVIVQYQEEIANLLHQKEVVRMSKSSLLWDLPLHCKQRDTLLGQLHAARATLNDIQEKAAQIENLRLEGVGRLEEEPAERVEDGFSTLKKAVLIGGLVMFGVMVVKKMV